MSDTKNTFKDKVSSLFHALGKESPAYEDAKMLVGGAESEAKLSTQTVLRSINTEWLDEIERALPYLDSVIRNPSVAIEDVEEILPVEISRNINERSVKHLAQHTNFISDIKDDGEIIPSKILNVYRDETYLTYENKFINTLLARLSAFVDKRYLVLAGGGGAENKYKFDYSTSFDHFADERDRKNAAKISLSIELVAPVEDEEGQYVEADETFRAALARVDHLEKTLMSYRASVFAQKMGRSYIRPPVIRTNAILKNKNMKECLKLWEYIESFEGVGYSVQTGVETMLPSDDYISEMYSGVALQYLQFYDSITASENRLLSRKPLFDNTPDFASELSEEELADYMVYDAEYKKTVPVSVLANSRKRLSEDEKLMLEEITIALKADALLKKRREEEEARRKAEELARKLAEEEAKRREEEERKRREEEALRAAEEERRLAEEKRLAEEEARRLAEEQVKKRLEEEERARIEAEQRRIEEHRTKLAEAEFLRFAAEREAMEKAEDAFLPENDDMEGRYPICPYTRARYASLPRKAKKQVKKNMEKVLAYREAERRIDALAQKQGREEKAELAMLMERKATIRRELSGRSGWVELLDLTVKK